MLEMPLNQPDLIYLDLFWEIRGVLIQKRFCNLFLSTPHNIS